MSYRFADSCSRQQTCMTYTITACKWKTADDGRRNSETCRVLFQKLICETISSSLSYCKNNVHAEGLLRLWLLSLLSAGMWRPRVQYKRTDVSYQPAASNFRAENCLTPPILRFVQRYFVCASSFALNRITLNIQVIYLHSAVLHSTSNCIYLHSTVLLWIS